MWRKQLHVFDTAGDSKKDKPDEKTGTTAAKEVANIDDEALEYLPFDLIDDDVTL